VLEPGRLTAVEHEADGEVHQKSWTKEWARANGCDIKDRVRVSKDVLEAFNAAN
jgi:hypothetical protein